MAEEERERAERLQKALQARAAGPKFISAEPLLADFGISIYQASAKSSAGHILDGRRVVRAAASARR
jgi:hypothetical protein